MQNEGRNVFVGCGCGARNMTYLSGAAIAAAISFEFRVSTIVLVFLVVLCLHGVHSCTPRLLDLRRPEKRNKYGHPGVWKFGLLLTVITVVAPPVSIRD